MKRRCYDYSVVCWILCMVIVLTGCIKEDVGKNGQADNHVVTLNFPALQPYTSLSREGGVVNAISGESIFYTARIWIFSSTADENATAVAYKYVPDAVRYTDNTGMLRIEMTLPSRENGNFDIYVLVNDDVNSGLSEISLRKELEEKSFRAELSLPEKGLLMSRIVKSISLEQLESGKFTIPLERGVAKVGCYFTQSSDNPDFQINSVSFTSLQVEGMVFPEPITADQVDTRPSSPRIPISGEEISTPHNISVVNPIRVSEKILLTEGQEQAYVDMLNANATSIVPFYTHEALGNTIKCSINYQVGKGTQAKTAELTLSNDVIRNHFVVIYGHHYESGFDLSFIVQDWQDGGTLEIPSSSNPSTNFILNSSGTTPEGEDSKQIIAWYESSTASQNSWTNMANAAIFDFTMDSAHNWQFSCNNLEDFSYKIFNTDNGQEVSTPLATGRYVICVYPNHTLLDETNPPSCDIQITTYDVLTNTWNSLPINSGTQKYVGDDTHIRIKQTPARSNN